MINEHVENYKILNWKHFETLRFMLTGLTDHISRKNVTADEFFIPTDLI